MQSIDMKEGKIMSRINDFLNEVGIFYLATEDGDQPKMRPIGGHFELDGKLFFTIGKHKNVYRQMVKNPKVEIVALNKKAQWLRYTGTAVFENDQKYTDYAFEKNPGLKKAYNEQTGHQIGIFYLENATAEIISPDGSSEKLL